MTSPGDRTTLRQSRAFRGTALRSEVRRAWAVISIIVLIAGIGRVRIRRTDAAAG